VASQRAGWKVLLTRERCVTSFLPNGGGEKYVILICLQLLPLISGNLFTNIKLHELWFAFCYTINLEFLNSEHRLG
jgi:hypothetical protein